MIGDEDELDAWQAYLARTNAAQAALNDATAPARAVLEEARSAYKAAAAPAEAEFTREQAAAWEEYKSRVLSEDAKAALTSRRGGPH